MTDRKQLVIVGATGMVGGHALEIALADPGVASVTSIGRRTTGVEHPKLREVLHADFGDCAPLADELVDQDVALFCVGAYTGAVPDEELRRVTVDYVVAFARVLHEASPGAAFCLLSGQGADQREQSRVAFARYKGVAENAVLRAGFARTHLFRPGYIYPVVPRKEPTASYRAFRFLWPALRHVLPNAGISSVDLARVMVAVGLDGALGGEDPVLENRDLRRLARQVSPS